MTVDSERPGAAALARWLILTAVGLLVAFWVAFGIGTLPGRLGIDVATLGPGLRVDLALFLGLFGAFGLVAVLLAAQRVFGRRLALGASDLWLPCLGIGLAIAEELALHEWAEASLGSYDWDFVGWTAALSFILVLTAIASFGARIAPSGAARWPRVGVILGAGLVCLIVVSNVPAVRDGIGSNSWALVIAVGLSAAYAVSAIALAIWGPP